LKYPLAAGLLVVLVCVAALTWTPDPAAANPVPSYAELPPAIEIHHGVPGTALPLWSALPFVGMLLSIALFPLWAPHFWHRHFGKVAAFWAVALAAPFAFAFRGAAIYDLAHIILVDYIPFLILLWGLYTVAGGMIVRGSLRGHPRVNVALLGIGTLVASWIGTTGASMLLIRPVVRANAWRRHKTHVVVFFIFLVANIGGSLTPLGDPPLFLGFIHGVDFFWTLHLLPVTGFVVAVVLTVFFLLDRHYYRREAPPPTDAAREPLRVEGLHNLVFFGGIMGAVLFSGLVHLRGVSLGGIELEGQNLVRDGAILLMGFLSLRTTKKQLRQDNQFNWGPMKEVAILFAGIFVTIVPALSILRAGEAGAAGALIRGANHPWHFFWMAGGLSSFLDNAPTYLTFFATAIGKLYPAGLEEKIAAGLLMGKAAVLAQYPHLPSGFKFLEAISAGAVFMGANTYIGNAPNFMVKSMAEEAGVAMPSFFGYMIKYSLPVLVTTFVLTTLLFFR
jgi:Na+/H+ antiporter NhaD/arsenite permease-like protein